MRPSQPADPVPGNTGRAPTREFAVWIVPPADAADPTHAVADFVSTIGDLLLAEWLADHVPALTGRNLTIAGTDANTRRSATADEERLA